MVLLLRKTQANSRRWKTGPYYMITGASYGLADQRLTILVCTSRKKERTIEQFAGFCRREAWVNYNYIIRDKNGENSYFLHRNLISFQLCLVKNLITIIKFSISYDAKNLSINWLKQISFGDVLFRSASISDSLIQRLRVSSPVDQ